MTIVVPALGMTVAAFAVWLEVRIVNRRERWAKRTALGFVATLIAYPLSFGPVCWAHSRMLAGTAVIEVVYAPIIIYAADYDRPSASEIRKFANYGAWRSPPNCIPIALELDAETWINARRR
jgi:hypothetical protein